MLIKQTKNISQTIDKTGDSVWNYLENVPPCHPLISFRLNINHPA